jgi:hypothetical protein
MLMGQATLNQVISQLDTLKIEELQHLEAAVRERLRPASEEDKRAALYEALLASGLVKRIARRAEPDTSERSLIEVQGESVSETIIRERR